MKKLIIAEKPSLAMEIVKSIGNMKKNDGYFEGEYYIVSFAYGHLLTLFDVDDYFKREKTNWNLDELPFVPGEFIFKLKNDSGTKKQYKILKELIKRKDIDTIINSGDADREGEVIINNIIYKIFKEEKIEKEIERLWLKSINQEEIRNALSITKTIKETENIFNEGLARTYLDWLYGINLTRYTSLKTGGMLPVGRVLTPIVKKVYDKREEINNFKTEEYFEIDCKIFKDNQNINSTVKNSKFNVKEKLEVEEIVKKLNAAKSIVTHKEVKEIEKKPKKLFSLTTLQNHMVKFYKMPLDKTLNSVQNLYEKGYLTYPRTNTEYLHTSEINDVKKLINKYADIGYDIQFKNTKSIFDDTKVESHSALLPTQKDIDIKSMSHDDKNIYVTIFNRFLANFCIEKTIVEEVKVEIEALDYKIELKGNTINQKGFYKYENIDAKEKLLPNFNLGDIVYIEYINNKKSTTPPKLLTLVELNNYLKNPFKDTKKIEIENISEDRDEKEYINMLKGIEIGTVATRDSIIGNAIKYGYITEIKTVLDITEKGKYLINSLENLEIDLSREKTVETSILLKKIFRNEITVADVIIQTGNDFYKIMDKNIDIDKKLTNNTKTKETIGNCPICKKNVYESLKGFYCEDLYKEPKCNFYIGKNNKFFTDKGKRPTAKNIKDLISEKEIKLTKLKSKTGKEYNAYVKLKLPIEKYVNFEMRF